MNKYFISRSPHGSGIFLDSLYFLLCSFNFNLNYFNVLPMAHIAGNAISKVSISIVSCSVMLRSQ